MSDETTGWTRASYECYLKEIHGYQFVVREQLSGAGWYLTVYNCFIKEAPLRELQHLAHATAQLWAGETSDE